jgi:hypothetical protein
MFGHGQIFIKIKGQESDEARKLPLVIDPATIKKGSLLGFAVVEPLWTTPYAYNSNDPTAPDFYKPRAWFVLGKQTHADRLLSFISRPVPDMLKPAYNFGGPVDDAADGPVCARLAAYAGFGQRPDQCVLDHWHQDRHEQHANRAARVMDCLRAWTCSTRCAITVG